MCNLGIASNFHIFFGPNLFIYLLKILALHNLITVTFSKVIILNFFRPRYFLFQWSLGIGFDILEL